MVKHSWREDYSEPQEGVVFNGQDPTLNLTRVRRPCLGCNGVGMIEDNDHMAIVCIHCRGVGSTDLPVPNKVRAKRRGLEDGILSKPLRDAMYDIAKWKDLFCWRQHSMVRLWQLGLVERNPNPPRNDIHYWQLTDRGKQWLADHPEGMW